MFGSTYVYNGMNSSLRSKCDKNVAAFACVVYIFVHFITTAYQLDDFDKNAMKI